MTGSEAASVRVDRASRIVHADPARVFAALVDRDALERWLPPAGMTGRLEHFDARPGGSYRMVLEYDDPQAIGKTAGGTDVVDVRFIDVRQGERVVQAVDFVSDDPELAGTMTMTWSVQPAEGGARVEVCADGVPAGISAEDHEGGMASSLQNLADHVEASGS